MSIQIAVGLDVDALMTGGGDARDFIDLIKELDEAMHDWGFTLELADHFDRLRAEHAAEVAEDAAKRAAERALAPTANHPAAPESSAPQPDLPPGRP